MPRAWGSRLRILVPRMQCSVQRCAADPGSMCDEWIPALRSSVTRCTASGTRQAVLCRFNFQTARMQDARSSLRALAKQFMATHKERKERMDCFVASLPCANASRLSQAMMEDAGSLSRGAIRPSFVLHIPPSYQRAQGMPGAGAPAAARVV
jgi:hypothetical protein